MEEHELLAPEIRCRAHIIIEKNSLKSTNYYKKKFAVEHELLAAEIRCRLQNRIGCHSVLLALSVI